MAYCVHHFVRVSKKTKRKTAHEMRVVFLEAHLTFKYHRLVSQVFVTTGIAPNIAFIVKDMGDPVSLVACAFTR